MSDFYTNLIQEQLFVQLGEYNNNKANQLNTKNVKILDCLLIPFQILKIFDSKVSINGLNAHCQRFLKFESKLVCNGQDFHAKLVQLKIAEE